MYSVLLVITHIQLSFSYMEVTVSPINENDDLVGARHISHTDSPFDDVSTTLVPGIVITERGTLSGKNQNYSVHDAGNSTRYIEDTRNKTTQPEFVQLNLTYNLKGCDGPKQNIILIPDLSNCSNYYELCSENPGLSFSQYQLISATLTNVKSCMNGTTFDSLSGQCVQIGENAYCGLYDCAKPDGFFEDPTSRYTFIHCFDGIPKRKLCEPKGTAFFNQSKVCMWIPEDTGMGLRIFQAFIWLVKWTEPDPTELQDGIVNSITDFIKMSCVAVLIPFVYMLTVVVLYKQFSRPGRNQNESSLLSDEDDFHHRYFRRPARSCRNAINLQPLTNQATSSTSNILNDSYFVTTSF